MFQTIGLFLRVLHTIGSYKEREGKMDTKTLDQRIEEAAEMILASDRIMVFTGAGVSTESGIPDFRSPGGIWTQYDPEDFTIQKFLSDREIRKKLFCTALPSPFPEGSSSAVSSL